MYYVYLIRSISYPDQKYVGCTEDLENRIDRHNYGTTPHTAKYKPWGLIAFCAFDTKEKATAFEKFLKSGSGREFAKRRFW
jgi:predicted GIY-YIG superfamily endonuclease